MDSAPLVADMTGFDVASQLISALAYLAAGAAAVGQAPRDRRTQVFLALALMNAMAFTVPVFGWFLGVKNLFALGRMAVGSMLAALAVGALLMFHFSQLFPRRRPWLQGSGVQLPVAYVLVPVVTLGLILSAPQNVASVKAPFVAAFLVFGFPLIVLLGLVLPFAAVLSFLRSYRDASITAGSRDARPVLAAILLSQVAGGVLAVVFAPILTTVAPGSISLLILTGIIWALGLLTPIAFAAGIWFYKLLEIDPG